MSVFSSLGHQLTVNSVPFQEDVPVRVNIKKRRENIVYHTLSDRDNINIAYLIGQETTPSNNLFISDRSTSLNQNRILSSQDIQTETTATLELGVDKFLVTDQFTTETPTRPETPLFYVHALEYYNDDLDDFDNRTLLSFEFADYNLQTKDLTEYVLDTDTGKIYNNIENFYDSGDGSFSITFIKYTVRTISGSTQSVGIHHELISNRPVFEQASFEDIDEFGTILAGHKKYLIDELPGGQLFTITLPQVARYAYKEIPESRLNIIEPTAVDISTPWHIQVRNGKFITALRNTPSTYLNYKYYLAEFNSQNFSPYPPYKIQFEQKATWINSNIVYVPKNIVLEEEIGLNIEIIIRDQADDLQYAYTTNASQIGSTYEGSILYTAGILSIDAANGFIELNDAVKDSDSIVVTYYTEEDLYEFTNVDFNPINNLDILDQRIVLYATPETLFSGALSRSLYYLIVNTRGEITYSSQATSGATDFATTKMLNEDFTTTGDPRHTFYYDIESTASGLQSRITSGLLLDDHIEEFSFIDKYTVESVLFTTAVVPSGMYLENYKENPHFLVLGDVYVGESQSPDSLTTFDMRTPGGGIKEEYKEDAMQENPNVAWYWDFNAQRPYPGVGAFMAELPQTLLEEHGGSFTRNQIEDIVSRHMKAGGYAILKTYGVNPSINTVTVGSGHIAITWPSYGSSVNYNVYHSLLIDSAFELDTDLPLSDNAGGNSYTITNLNSSTKYYVKVEGIDENEDSSFGQTISATTATAIV